MIKRKTHASHVSRVQTLEPPENKLPKCSVWLPTRCESSRSWWEIGQTIVWWEGDEGPVHITLKAEWPVVNLPFWTSYKIKKAEYFK